MLSEARNSSGKIGPQHSYSIVLMSVFGVALWAAPLFGALWAPPLLGRLFGPQEAVVQPKGEQKASMKMRQSDNTGLCWTMRTWPSTTGK